MGVVFSRITELGEVNGDLVVKGLGEAGPATVTIPGHACGAIIAQLADIASKLRQDNSAAYFQTKGFQLQRSGEPGMRVLKIDVLPDASFRFLIPLAAMKAMGHALEAEATREPSGPGLGKPN